jgi:hypothetical protein
MVRRSLLLAIALTTTSVAHAAPFALTDSLKGATKGNATGGTLGPDGWTVTGPGDRVVYEIPTLASGVLEVTATGITTASLVTGEAGLVAMYEDGFGLGEPIAYDPRFRNNYSRVLLRVFGQTEPDRAGQQGFTWSVCPVGKPGYSATPGCPCGGGGFLEAPIGGDATWDGTPQTLRIEWENGKARYLRNGMLVHAVDWSATGLAWGPALLHVSLGAPTNGALAYAAMPLGATLSDLSITGTIGAEAPICISTMAVDPGGAGGASGACSPETELVATSVSPISAKGPTESLHTVVSSCHGADAVRVVSLAVGEPTQDHLEASFEDGLFHAGAASCAPGQAKSLSLAHGTLDCAASKAALVGDEVRVDWALAYDVATYAGPHGIWLSARGGPGNPEPFAAFEHLADVDVENPPKPPSGTGGGGSSAQGGSPALGNQGSPTSAGAAGAPSSTVPVEGTPAPASHGGGCATSPSTPSAPWFVTGLFALIPLLRRREARRQSRLPSSRRLP